MNLKGRYVTFLCRITDPEKYAGENPMMTHQVAGVEIVGLSAGDLMGFTRMRWRDWQEGRTRPKSAPHTRSTVSPAHKDSSRTKGAIRMDIQLKHSAKPGRFIFIESEVVKSPHKRGHRAGVRLTIRAVHVHYLTEREENVTIRRETLSPVEFSQWWFKKTADEGWELEAP